MIKAIVLLTSNIRIDPVLIDKHDKIFSDICEFFSQSFSGTYYQFLSSFCFGFNNSLKNRSKLAEKKIKYHVRYTFDLSFCLRRYLEADKKLNDYTVGYLNMEFEDISCLVGIKAAIDTKYNGIVKMHYLYFDKKTREAYCSTNHNHYDEYIIVNYNDLSSSLNVLKNDYASLLMRFLPGNHNYKNHCIAKNIETKLSFLDAAKKENPIKMSRIIKKPSAKLLEKYLR